MIQTVQTTDNVRDNSSALLWAPDEDTQKSTQLSAFMRHVGHDFDDYQTFWQWSAAHSDVFWSKLWDYFDIIGEQGDVVLQNPESMRDARFFPQGAVNYAENMLRRRDENVAIIFRNEREEERELTHKEFYDRVSQWVQALRAQGVGKGDRVAGYMPNMPETIIVMLAAASIGAIWSSASPDFGAQGVIDRFGQIEPKVLVCVDGYYYNGKVIDCLAKIKEIQPALKGLQKTIIVPFVEEPRDLGEFNKDTLTEEMFIGEYEPCMLTFERFDFNHPLFIMFSSGTTGVPKCIVHGHGGTLIQHVKEHRLHCDLREGDKIFYFTTCGWMMWNWLVTGLASGATLLLYDGSPFHPDGNVLWDFADAHDCKLFGTSAKYIDALKAHDFEPAKTHDLQNLRTVTSTGSPLVHESFDYVYDSIKKDVHLASISGGTDIVSCFVLGNPISPVYRGEIQGAGLAMAVDVFDEDGKPIPAGAGSGELVCTKPFPCMPVSFWNDDDGQKYHDAYFGRFDNVWCHGDWIERTEHNGFIIHGRSDATLNPGGVRIGTSEIYRQVEKIPQVLESIAVGQDWEGDVRVILFVILKDGETLDEGLIKEIKTNIRNGASPRHMPAKVIQVTDIPRTKSGKITELAVRDVIHNRKIKNSEALANPEALALYKDLEELTS
jgi:acetoacetyl-CoA synthetase